MRLVMKPELAPLGRDAQRVLEFDSLGRVARHGGGVVLEAVPAGGLDPLHRGIGVAQQHLEVFTVPREGAGTKAQTDVLLASFQREQQRRRLLDLAHQGDRLVGAYEIRGQHREAVGSQARRGIALAHRGAQPLGQQVEQRVASRLAEAFVHQLEAINVQHDQAARPPRSSRMSDRLSGAVGEQAAVGQARKRVVIRQIADARLIGVALLCFREGAFYRRAKPAHAAFQDVIRGPHPNRRDGALLADRPRQENERNLRHDFPGQQQRLHAIKPWHREIGQDCVRSGLRESHLHGALRVDLPPQRLKAVTPKSAQRQLDILRGVLDEKKIYRRVVRHASAFAPL